MSAAPESVSAADDQDHGEHTSKAGIVGERIAAELLRALDFAAARHRDQRRKGVEASPYINHAIKVARLLAEVGGIAELVTLQAAILHDTIEDTKTTIEELEHAFGSAVRALVEEVTDDRRLVRRERWRRQIEAAPSLSNRAKAIRIADKIANVLDVAEIPPRDWTIERRHEYLDWAARVVAGCMGVNAALEARWAEALANARQKLEAHQISVNARQKREADAGSATARQEAGQGSVISPARTSSGDES